MTPDRWAQIRAVFGAAFEGPDFERAGILDSACRGDPELRMEVERMLAANEKPTWESPSTGLLAARAPLAPGDMVLHYRVETRLGEGGMGTVYRVHDTRLHRDVALKFVKVQFSARAEREARAVAALNHPNICTLHDVGPDYLVMELIDGPTLAERIAEGPIPLDEALDIARQIVQALECAHQRGVLHRDLKPGNIMLSKTGVKVVDFGLAKIDHQAGHTETETMTADGSILGTPAYMSPEQAESKPLDAHSDQFSFGAVLYEMLTGKRAFEGQSPVSTLAAVIYRDPQPLGTLVKVPVEIEHIVNRCLRKQPAERHADVSSLRADLERCRARISPVSPSPYRQLRRPRFLIPAVLVFGVLAVLLVSFYQRYTGTRWAASQAIPEVARLVDDEKVSEAFALARRAGKYLPDDPRLAKLWPLMAQDVTVETIPEGAEVFRKDYDTPEAPWQRLGLSPINDYRLPQVLSRWKLVKPGYTTVEGCLKVTPGKPQSIKYRIALDREDQTPSGMVRVQTINFLLGVNPKSPAAASARNMRDYWIDRYEVSNRQFKQFVDAGGYRNRAWWKPPVMDRGVALSWEQAMARFIDTTSRPGPAPWQQSDFSKGEADYPVSGVSWYEAAAYCEFAGKSLPTVAHWRNAAGVWNAGSIVPSANFGGKGIAPVGASGSISSFGTYDMDGNVKEWCWNEEKSGKRYTLGGAWDEAPYMAVEADARPPLDRHPNLGFRCVKYLSPGEPGTAADPIVSTGRDYSLEKPCSSDRYSVYTSLYGYDKTPLNARVEAGDQTTGYRAERVTFDAAYGNERIVAWLIQPAGLAPPWQTVVLFPSSNALREHLAWPPYLKDVEFLLKSGRAVVIPAYKGTFERRDDFNDTPNTSSRYRDHVIAWVKDLRRSIDYLETRPDIDASKLGYYGLSMGARMGPLMSALERRIKANIWMNGGFRVEESLPEVDPFHHAPHVNAATLMLNGRYDFLYPEATSQNPMFGLLATAANDKRHIVYATSHDIPRTAVIKETLDWLDRYLGPVK